MLKPAPLYDEEDMNKLNEEFLNPFGALLQMTAETEIEVFANRFKSPLLRKAFLYILQQKNA